MNWSDDMEAADPAHPDPEDEYPPSIQDREAGTVGDDWSKWVPGWEPPPGPTLNTYEHAQRYIGLAHDPGARLEAHRSGRGIDPGSVEAPEAGE